MKFVSLALLAFTPLIAHAQDSLPSIPDNGQPLRITRARDIPPVLHQAMARSDCRLGEVTLSTFAILLFRPAAGAEPIALVPCEGVVLHGRAFRSDGEPISFQVLAFADRLSETETPGLFFWDAQARTLTAQQGNDECDGTVMRHSYRPADASGAAPARTEFTLTKVERGRLGCGFGENWRVVWEAR